MNLHKKLNLAIDEYISLTGQNVSYIIVHPDTWHRILKENAKQENPNPYEYINIQTGFPKYRSMPVKRSIDVLPNEFIVT